MKLPDILGLLPPTHIDKAQNDWQRSITAGVLLLIAAVVSASGVLGQQVYQTRVEQSTIKQQITDLGVSLKSDALFTKIMMLRTRYCDAQNRHLEPERGVWDKEILFSLAEYAALTKRSFPPFNPC